ncbi:MAG TPA: glycosyltransferase, partial [Paracoccaceae bacterium]|nr:glycosyltransferase [Paracoccaceae bacterium]
GPMRVALTTALSARGIADRVALAGWRDGAGVRAALAGAQALILPSFAEGLPVVAMEAMAAGRPVLATAVAGLPELVEPGRSGWLVPAGDATALAEGIDRIADLSPEELAAMGRAARVRVMERHDVTRSAALLIQLFAEPPRR